MTAKEEAENIFKTYLRYTPVEFEYEYAKKCALIDIQNRIDLIKYFIEESVNVYQSLNTPKKLCIDILNPKLKNLEAIKSELEKL